MATRMQQRRGTAAQWTSANPILAAGEIGFESDTNQFKIGDGIDHWDDLSYFKNLEDLGGSLDDYILLTQKGAINGVAELDANSNVMTKSGVVFEGVTANAHETTLAVTEPTADRVIALPDATGVVVLGDEHGNVIISGDLTVSGTTTIIDSTTINVQNNIRFEGTTANEFETGLTAQDPTADRTITLPDATGTIVLENNSQTLSSKSINLNANTVTGTISEFNTALSDADFATLAAAETLTNKTLTSPKINEDVVLTATATELNVLDGITASTAELNVLDGSNITTAELNILSGATLSTSELNTLDGVTASASEINTLDGITSSTAELNILDGVTASSAELNILDGATLSTAELNTLDGITASVAELNILDGVTATASQINVLGSLTASAVELNILDGATLSTEELNYVDGVTSSIQTQLNDKQPKVANVSDIEIGYLDGVTSAIQTQLNAKQATVSGVSDVEIGYLDGVTSSIQTQLDAKSTASKTETLTNKTLTSPVINTPTGITKSDVGLTNVDNTSDANKPVSTATQTALDLKANLAAPTFTGTVVLPSTTSIGNVSATELGYVDGVTSSIQTQLDAKLAKSGGTMTGALTLSGAPTSDLHAATKLYVDNVTAGINFHQAAHAATTANLSADYNNGTGGIGATLTASANGTWTTLDGHTSFTQYDRILVKNQTDAKQNGIYILSDLGSAGSKWILTRATDADNNPTGEMKTGDFTFVQNGTVNASVGYINNSTANPIVIGTDNISYTEFNAGKTVVAGNGLQESTPGTLSIDTTVTQARVANVSDTEIGYLDGVTSAIQTQIDAKAPIASPTFTGTVTVAASGVAFTDGTQTKEGVPSRTPIIQKTASYTLSALTERDSLIEVSSASATTVTIPLNSAVAYPVGTSIDILQTSTGQVTIAGAAGVTVNATPGLKLRTTWSSCTLFKRATDTWVVYGDLTA